MKPQAFFEIGRNEPCPCGGAQKYKRCCLDRVEAARRALAARLGSPGARSPAHMDLLRGLALACGLPPDPDLEEEPADIERVSGAFRAVVDAAQEDDVGPVRELHEALELLLREDRELRALRFWPPAAQEAFAAATLEGPLDLDDEEAVDRLIGKALAPLVVPDLADDVAWGLVAALRNPTRTDEELRALIWGLLNAVLTFHAPLGDNLLWRSLLRLTIQDMDGFVALAEALERARRASGAAEAAAADAGAPASGTGDPSGTDGVGDEGDLLFQDLARYVHEHPIIDRMLSRDYYEKVAPALDAIAAGALPMRVPPYALAFALHRMWSVLAPGLTAVLRAALPAAHPGEAETARVVLPGDAALPRLTPTDLQAVTRSAWEQDYPLLVPAVAEALEAWLARQGGSADRRLATAVRHLADTFGDGFLDAHWRAFQVVVLTALNLLFKENPPLTPPTVPAGEDAGEAPEDEGPERLLHLFLRPGAGERYAAALEAAGLAEAAAHVRAAARIAGAGPNPPADAGEGA